MLYWDPSEPSGDRPQVKFVEKIVGDTPQVGSTFVAIGRHPTAVNTTKLKTIGGYSDDGEVIKFCAIQEEDEEALSDHAADGMDSKTQGEEGAIVSHMQRQPEQQQEKRGDDLIRVAQEWDAIDQVGIGLVVTSAKTRYPTTIYSCCFETYAAF